MYTIEEFDRAKTQVLKWRCESVYGMMDTDIGKTTRNYRGLRTLQL